MTIRRVLAMTSGLLLLGATMAGAQASKSAGSSAGDMNRHSMEGEVTKVDAKKGWIDVKTSEGSMKLHYPPEALASVKKGDSVTVELGIKDNGPSATGSSSPSSRGTSSSGGTSTPSGTSGTGSGKTTR